MIAVIYKGFIYPEREAQYKAAWKKIAHYFIEHRGAKGSMLHKTSAGEYLAYSLWPDEATRNASWGKERGGALPSSIEEAIHSLKNSIDMTQHYEEITMELIEDLLTQR